MGTMPLPGMELAMTSRAQSLVSLVASPMPEASLISERAQHLISLCRIDKGILRQQEAHVLDFTVY